ncbi:hypothetical protein GOBAR_DD07654 [Gossypium barbadense]|nr:hypothetical protein GOBAR_DD07654 [Gossypium barbadense]
MINLLDLTCPMKESTNVIYALHLTELMARDSPVFIAHHKHETNATVDAISPPKLMHEDICTMALDNVLDRAPCSIGILINRGERQKSMKLSSYSVGILFLGGKDDREALILAKRMAQDPRVKLTNKYRIADERL